MKFFKHSLLFTAIIGIFLLAGCRSHRRERVFETLATTTGSVYCQSHHGITCKVKKLSYEETVQVFGADLLKENIQPFYLTIHNDTPDMWYLSARHISAPLASDDIVKQALYIPTATYTTVSALVALIYCWPLIPVLIIPAGLWSSSVNKEIDHFMQEHSIKAQDRAFYSAPREHIKKVFCIYGWEPGAHFEIGIIRDKDGMFTKFIVTI